MGREAGSTSAGTSATTVDIDSLAATKKKVDLRTGARGTWPCLVSSLTGLRFGLRLNRRSSQLLPRQGVVPLSR